MKILITGAKGFIGSHLYKEITENKVIGLDNNFHTCFDNSSIIGDIRNSELIDELISKVDLVIHLAAIIHVDYSIKYPQETFDVNCNGTLNILEACRKYNKKLIFASSSEIFGTSQTNLMDENHLLNPQSPYAASKVFGDKMCYSYWKTYGLPVVILRNFNIFGPYQNSGEGAGSSYGSVISIFISRALKDKPLYIFGDGEQERDYMYINDAVKAYKLCINNFDKLIGQALNMGSGKTITINRLAELVIKLTDSKSEIIHTEPRAGEVRRLCCDNRKALSYGLVPTTNFERDLSDYIKWYKSQ